ncbi:hypothetical protein ANCCAN_13642 [Ancylostoma caninum]|uniref:IBR domain-containing protein n=1 Tax=Ancylostoma caninum TaxID=29170 RepID=A0A368G7K6_ANCCA|nr:hypothetical protein ANCCAN_13642 [Ancylostoma caninum]
MDFLRSYYHGDDFEIVSALITSNDTTPLDLLYAVLPLPVMSLFLKTSYSYYSSLLYPHFRLLQCPQCSVSLAVTDKDEFNCSMCSNCGCCWCCLCDWEPHWPLTCEEFKKWSEKWDTQYPIDKFNLDEGERLLRIQCHCENIFYAPENTAHWTPCFKCCYLYDKDGILRSSFDLFWPYPPRHRKEYHDPDDEFYKYGYRVQPEYLEQKKLINKHYSTICVDARKLRFDERKKTLRHSEDRRRLRIIEQKRTEFADAVIKKFPSETEQHRVIDIRQTALFLVENCTAWLYLHRAEKNRILKETVSLLFRQILLFQDQILDDRSDHKGDVVDLEKCVSDVIDLFRSYIAQNEQ